MSKNTAKYKYKQVLSETEYLTLETEQTHDTIDDYNQNSIKFEKGIEILLINVRSLHKNYNNLLLYMNKLRRKPDVLVCTESRILDCPTYYNIKDYDIYYNESKINKADGTVVYVKSKLKSTTIIETFNNAKFLSTTITGNNGNQINISSIKNKQLIIDL